MTESETPDACPTASISECSKSLSARCDFARGCEPSAGSEESSSERRPTMDYTVSMRSRWRIYLEPERKELSNTIDGRYDLIQPIARGAQGVVYRATERRIDGNRLVAIKLFRPVLERPRFLCEAELIKANHHDHLVSVYDYGEHAGFPYVVMEYLRGDSLREALRSRQAVPWRTAVHYAIQLCKALDFLHQINVVHRDIKPDNCLIERSNGNGEVLKLIDFGISVRVCYSALTATGPSTTGTLPYMAPETILGRGYDHRSDLYSLGATLYELITGCVPFPVKSLYELCNVLSSESSPTAPSSHGLGRETPDAIDKIVLKALARDPERRFRSANELAESLTRVIGEEPRGRDQDIAVLGDATSDPAVQDEFNHATAVFPRPRSEATTLDSHRMAIRSDVASLELRRMAAQTAREELEVLGRVAEIHAKMSPLGVRVFPYRDEDNCVQIAIETAHPVKRPAHPLRAAGN